MINDGVLMVMDVELTVTRTRVFNSSKMGMGLRFAHYPEGVSGYVVWLTTTFEQGT